MRHITSAFFAILLLAGAHARGATYSFDVKEADIRSGYITEKVWLTYYASPQVVLSDLQYADATLPVDARSGNHSEVRVKIGEDHKKPFALIFIPAYSQQNGKTVFLQHLSLTCTETPPSGGGARLSGARTAMADTNQSVLATGTWYKIGVTRTGFYKIDYNFLKSLGLDPATTNPANIRIYGNGGHMLPENNSVPRIADLRENAVEMVGGAGGVFNSGDYMVFYATGPTEWDKDSTYQRFVHKNNIYTDTAYYFLTVSSGEAGLRVATQGSVPTANETVTTYNYYLAHDTDEVNPAAMGKIWYGEEFTSVAGNTTQSFVYNFPGAATDVYATVAFAELGATSGSTVSISLNGTTIGSQGFGATDVDNFPIFRYTASGNISSGISSLSVTVKYFPADDNCQGYLNYIEVNCRLPLSMTGSQMTFRDWKSVGAGNVANYQLQGASAGTQVWDVTDPQAPVLMAGSLSGSTYSFTQDAGMLHEFATFNGSSFYTPTYVGQVANQNLHGSGPVTCLIVTNPAFLDAANQLAAYHTSHDNMSVLVATTSQIYNEFSSGAQDVSAIRDFARMFYIRAGNDTTKMPRYLVLFGNGSYDYKNRIPNNDDLVPAFESDESYYLDNAYCSDDFFAMLDSNENINNLGIVNLLDIGVGRLPARSVNDANSLVAKIVNYHDTSTLGPWRLATMYCADKCDDAGDHTGAAEQMASTVVTTSKGLYNENKVYLNAIPAVQTPAGPRCPTANAAIDAQVFNGVFLINYNGHGNTEVWAGERMLTQDDYNNWNNARTLPFVITGTCDFGQYDHPQYVSAAEQLVVRSGGGVIAELTTTQAVYEQYNIPINSSYLAAQLSKGSNGQRYTFGDAVRVCKNSGAYDPGQVTNNYKFTLLGDPALTPDFPEYNVSVDSIVDNATGLPSDTAKSLGAYRIVGSVRDLNANVMNNFNGNIWLSFFDKPRLVPISGCSEESEVRIQNNVIYKGKATVTNGKYSFVFIVPKDINYYFGSGKISLYADNGMTDAAGVDTGITVGGFSDNPVMSTTGPTVKPYMNDSLFLNGGITGPNSVLFVSLWDETGINVSGSAIGHDLTAVLDSNISQPYILNDYYQTAPNSYQQGYVYFPINNLSDGQHSITVTAWDVNDNVGKGTVDFVVADGEVIVVKDLINYPNPFSDVTHFVFEHNHPGEELKVQISIYNMVGVFVKSLSDSFIPSGSRSNEITWDGTDNYGSKLPSGVYVYRLKLSTESGFKTTAYQKLVIVR
jgi:Peptidase family C25